MARCKHCGSQMGLVQLFWYTREFCTKWCSEQYQKKLQQEHRQKQFLQWLHGGIKPT